MDTKYFTNRNQKKGTLDKNINKKNIFNCHCQQEAKNERIVSKAVPVLERFGTENILPWQYLLSVANAKRNLTK